MMIVPMFISATINTFAPGVFKIGGFVTAIMTNHNVFIGAFLVCMGAGMTFKSAPKALKIGGVTTLTKYAFSVGLGLLVNYLFGPAGFLGLSALAIIVAVSNTNGGSIMIPFMALAMGTRLDFRMILTAGSMGVVLGLICVGVGGALNIFADRITGGTGVAGAACSSTAGNAVGVPLAIAAVDPTLEAAAAAATPYVAAAMITTAICTPILTTFVYKRNLVKHPDWLSGKDRAAKEAAEALMPVAEAAV